MEFKDKQYTVTKVSQERYLHRREIVNLFADEFEESFGQKSCASRLFGFVTAPLWFGVLSLLPWRFITA